MPGLFDALQAIMGRGDPMSQIANMVPGGPGAGPGGPPGSGAPGTPPTPGAPPAGSPGPQQQPQQPQAYQSPADMQNMYLQLVQRSRAEDQFNRGLALFAASAYPGRRPDLIMNSIPPAQDPGAIFGNLMKLQQWSYLQQQEQAFQRAVPGIAGQMFPNMDQASAQDAVRALGPDAARIFAQSNIPPEMARTYHWVQEDWARTHQNDKGPDGAPIGLEGARSQFQQQNPPGMFVAGMMPTQDPNLNQMRVEAQQWLANHQGSTPADLPPRYTDAQKFAVYKQQVQDQQRLAGKAPATDAALLDLQGKLGELTSPDNANDMKAIMGWHEPTINAVTEGGWKSEVAKQFGVTENQAHLFNVMRDLQDTKFSEMVAANPDAANDLYAIHQNLSALTPGHFQEGPEKFGDNANAILNNIKKARANNFGRAGQLGKISAAGLDPFADDSYLPGGVNYTGDAKRMGPTEVAGAQSMANQIDNDPNHPELKGQGMAIAKRHYKMLGFDADMLGG